MRNPSLEKDLARRPQGMRGQKSRAARSPRRNFGPLPHWLSGVGEFTSPFFFPWPPPKLWRLRFGLGSSGFYSQTVCDHLVHQCERCKSAESRISLLARHIAALLRCGRDTRLVSSLQSKTINFRIGDDSIKRDFRERKRAVCYPQSCTLLTFPQTYEHPFLSHIWRSIYGVSNSFDRLCGLLLRAVSWSSLSRRADMIGSAAV